MNTLNKKRGFTLIEMTITVLIHSNYRIDCFVFIFDKVKRGRRIDAINACVDFHSLKVSVTVVITRLTARSRKSGAV